MSAPRWDKLTDAYREGVDEPLAAERATRQRRRLLSEAAPQRGSGQLPVARWRSWSLGFGLAAAAAGALVAWLLVREVPVPSPTPATAVAYLEDGRQVSEGERLEAASEKPLAVSFTDGSKIELAPGARVRAERLARQHVDLAVESGRLRAHIRHAPGTRWRYRAGPYRILIVGTVLEIVWAPETQRLAVEVTRGRVEVRGGRIGAAPLIVAGGQRLEADEARGARLDTSSSPADEAPRDAATGLTEDAAPEVGAAEPSRSVLPSRSARSLSARWRGLMLQGHHRAAWREVHQIGFEKLRKQLDRRDLFLLADLARVRGHMPEAREAFQALRTRFRGSPQGQQAAFYLGRLALDREGDHASAARWFRTYLREAPRGERAADARGRLMAALDQLGQKEEAREVARKYLAAHPEGAYSDLARTLLEGR